MGNAQSMKKINFEGVISIGNKKYKKRKGGDCRYI